MTDVRRFRVKSQEPQTEVDRMSRPRTALAAALLFLVSVTAAPGAALPAEPEPLRIAVLPMSSAMPDVPAVALEGALIDALVRSSHYSVVSRTQMDKLLAEQRLNN